MAESWSILTTRYGEDIRSPSLNQLVTAVAEVADPEHSDDIEHTEAFLRHGYDDGPMYVLGYTVSGRMYFEQWNDQDFESELAPEVSVHGVSPDDAVLLMQDLCDGAVDKIKEFQWT